MPFKSYPKIHRLGSEENEGILLGTCIIQEKIDGANTSIWQDEDGIKCGSRTQLIGAGFNGFFDYVQAHEGVKKLLVDFPYYHLYAEWLVRHTIAYKETAYRRMYLFDIWDTVEQKFKPQEEVQKVAAAYGIDYAFVFGTFENPTVEQLDEFVGKTQLGDHGEGIVIKNEEYVNKFGDMVYAKIVTQKFKEDNALVFGGNNKHSETYWETYVMQKYVTLARVQKIMNKIQPIVDHRLGVEDTARIINTVWFDLWVEECWEIQKKIPRLDFKKTKILCCRKAAKVYHDILDDHISVAYEEGN